MAKILIGCKLPHGIVLTHPQKEELSVTLDGLNKSAIIGSTFVQTEVEEEFWNVWKQANKDSKLLSSGALFEAKNQKDLLSASKDTGKTGFEPLNQDTMGVSAA